MSLNDFARSLSPSALDALLAETEQRLAANRIRNLYPDEGPLRRELYAKHMQFFAAGATFQERCFMAGNRVGKTVVGAFETTLHLTGDYPDWWDGRRFAHPVDWWACGDTAETTRDIVQFELLGPIEQPGFGMIPKNNIVVATRRAGVVGAIDQVVVRHKTGGDSRIGFKSYDQGRKKFQGTKKHGIWDDEEPPSDVYDEQMLRLMTTDGLMMCTFTPLMGLTEIARRYLPNLAPVMTEPKPQAIPLTTGYVEISARDSRGPWSR